MEAASPPIDEPREVAWNDPKRYLWLIGLVVPLIPFLTYGLAELSGLGLAYWFGPVVVFGIIPLLDQLIGKDSANPPDSAIKYLEQDRYYRWCTYLFLPLQFGGLIFATYLWSSGNLTFFESLGLALSVAMVAGIAINTAHELGHKRKGYERWLSKVALAQTFYGHFFIEHNRGHHVRVATPEDPASSRLGETFWEFLPRTVSGSLSSAIELERERLDRLGKGFWTLDNDVLNAWAMSVALFAGLTIAFGPVVLPFLLIQAVVGFSLLEVVNYLEHYGLRRQWDHEKDRYELCRPEHSWNSDNIASNVFLYHLQRHSDHHANPVRRYQALRHFDDAPELPSGYATMIVIALIPPLWRKVMDHRVVEHYDGDVARANIYPRRREQILDRWGSSSQDSAGAGASTVPDRLETHDPRASDTTAAPGAPDSEADAYRCPGCDYTYVVAEGAPREGFEAGTPWAAIPERWPCPDCGVREARDFEPVAGGQFAVVAG